MSAYQPAYQDAYQQRRLKLHEGLSSLGEHATRLLIAQAMRHTTPTIHASVVAHLHQIAAVDGGIQPAYPQVIAWLDAYAELVDFQLPRALDPQTAAAADRELIRSPSTHAFAEHQTRATVFDRLNDLDRPATHLLLMHTLASTTADIRGHMLDDLDQALADGVDVDLHPAYPEVIAILEFYMGELDKPSHAAQASARRRPPDR